MTAAAGVDNACEKPGDSNLSDRLSTVIMTKEETSGLAEIRGICYNQNQKTQELRLWL